MTQNPVKDYVQSIHAFLIKYDRIILAVFLLVSMMQLWVTKYVPSLDGPQHIYNANVLKQLLIGDDLFREFFRINPVIVGYWSGHFALGFFKLFLPAWLAEKVFLTGYVLGMFFAFRYLIRSITGSKEHLLVYLIFPFIFHNYLLLGYYTFCIAAIFFFWAFGYWIRHQGNFGWKEMGIFGALTLGVFLSHGLVFLFFGAAFLIYFLLTSLHARWAEKSLSWRELLNRVWKLALAVAPAVILWAIYIRSVMDINSTVTEAAYSATELVKYLLRIRQLVGFNHEVESPPYIALFITMTILLLTIGGMFFYRMYKNEGKLADLFSPVNAWIFVIALFMIAYFSLPDRISAGSLTNRFGVYFFLSLIIFLAIVKIPKFLQVLALGSLLVVTIMARYNHQHFLHSLNKDIKDIQTMTEHMEDGSTVVSINTSFNWIHTHFQLYAADTKKLVHLNNPQCAGQFPIIWNERSLPITVTGERPYRPGGTPDVSGSDHRTALVDYITVFHHQPFWEDEANQQWQEILREHYTLVMTTPRELGALYQRKN